MMKNDIHPPIHAYLGPAHCGTRLNKENTIFAIYYMQSLKPMLVMNLER